MMRALPALLIAVLIAALLAAAPAPAAPGLKGHFEQAASETDEDLYQVKLFKSGKAYACGKDGIVIHSEDFGHLWDWVQIRQGISVRYMYWFDEKRGYFSAQRREENMLYRTTDGAKTFTRFRLDLPFRVRDFAFLTSSKGWLVAGSTSEGDGAWRFTTDGGMSWKQPEGIPYRIPARALMAIAAYGDKHLWTVGTHVTATMVGDAARSLLYRKKQGAVLHSSDGGETWEVQDAGNAVGTALYGVDFSDENHGWVVGDGGFAAYTKDGGKTWSTVETPTEKRLLAVSAVGMEFAVFVGYKGTAIATRDAGKTFTTLDTKTNWHIRDVSWVQEGKGVVVSKNGQALAFNKTF